MLPYGQIITYLTTIYEPHATISSLVPASAIWRVKEFPKFPKISQKGGVVRDDERGAEETGNSTPNRKKKPSAYAKNAVRQSISRGSWTL